MTSVPNLPKTFKAVVCPTPQAPWETITRKLTQPTADQILIRVHASGICASDHFVKEGTWPGLKYPRTPGHEAIGRIAAIGPALQDDKRFKLGGLVAAGWNGGYCNKCQYCRTGDFWCCAAGDFTGFTFDGGHAEYLYAPSTAVVSVPEEALEKASYAELAPLFCAGTTVYDAIQACDWSPGDICVVQGIGGLGHLAVQYATKLGLKVYALSTSDSKKSLASDLGAVGYIDASTTDPVEYIQSLGEISKIIPAVAKNGTVMLVSAAVDGDIKVHNLVLNMNRASLKGWCCGCAPDMEKCVKYSISAGIKPIVQEYSLDDFVNAYDCVIKNTARFRNVIVFP
ncbi:chaperonin 10-like protein [Infundibulicybe gibba]|nr:chaperonin 10-like protein [Infundibulicybe gibba]